MSQKKFPVKYIENNLVLNQKGEWFAYYELIPYNYTFLSSEQKIQLHESFRQLIAQSRDGKMHILQIAAEESVRRAQELSKKDIRGTDEEKELAYDFIDQQTENIIDQINWENEQDEKKNQNDVIKKRKETMVDYRFYLGMKLIEAEQEFTFAGIKEQLLNWLWEIGRAHV